MPNDHDHHEGSRRGVRLRAAPVLAALATSVALAAPPAAPVQDVADVLHGVRVPDPYRALENVQAEATRQWMKAQSDHAAATLAAIDVRDALQRRIAELTRSNGDSTYGFTRLGGGQLLYMKRKAGENQFKLMWRERLDAPERVLVDPEVVSREKGVPHAINWFSASWDGHTLAFGISAAGSEATSLQLMNIPTGRLIGEPVPRVQQGDSVSWTPDSRGLTFNQFQQLPPGAPETEAYKDSTVWHLRVGESMATARPVFSRKLYPQLQLDPLDVGGIQFDPLSRFMVLRTTDTTVPEGRLFVAPVRQLGTASAKKPVRWQQISSAGDKITVAQLRRDVLWLRSYAGAPRGRVLSLDLRKSQLVRAQVVVPEPQQGVITDIALGRDDLFVELRQGFGTRVLRHAPGSATGADVAPSLDGSVTLVEDPAHAHRDAWLVTSSWTERSRVMRSGPGGSMVDTGLRESKPPAGAPELVATEVRVPSHDGAPVPLAIVHRKGLALDGRNPTLLQGYGSYGMSYSAWYDPRALAWLERGGVLAYANVRGSGADGDAWHRAGFKTTKPNTWKDGIACAQYLIDKGYASAKTLAVQGGSAGGIFVGRAVTAAPQLFAAAVFDVGVLDAVRAELSANGATNISEFGTFKDPVEFRALLEMSTYHQIKDGTPYPGVLLTHGVNDPRVDVWHSNKAAARLQAATSSGKPVLLRLDMQAGHGVGSTAQQGIDLRADTYAFLLWQMGLASTKP